ncbi:protein G6b isoform G6b-E precursor [Camelus ferus]|nr:protein G6b isoform G6b-E precursor [Camelus ferus]
MALVLQLLPLLLSRAHGSPGASLVGRPGDRVNLSCEGPFASRLRALDLDIRRLELLLSTGDSGTFICKGQHQGESRTVLHVLGDLANCRAPEPTQVPLVKAEPQRPVEEEEPKISGGLDQESSLLYADLDHMALRRPCRLSPVAPADASTIYAVVV